VAASGASVTAQVFNSVSSALGKVAAPLVMTSAAAGLVELGGVAAAASGAIGLIPAVAAAAGAGIGTLKVATLGFGEALESIRDPEKFAEALQQLSPNAQQAALSIQGLLPQFDALKTKVQDALFANVGPQLTQLANTFLPGVESMTTRIAASFNTAFSGVTAMLMTPEMQATVDSLFGNIATSFERLAPAAAPFTEALVRSPKLGPGSSRRSPTPSPEPRPRSVVSSPAHRNPARSSSGWQPGCKSLGSSLTRSRHSRGRSCSSPRWVCKCCPASSTPCRRSPT
jgi:hypothetical protein